MLEMLAARTYVIFARSANIIIMPAPAPTTLTHMYIDFECYDKSPTTKNVYMRALPRNARATTCSGWACVTRNYVYSLVWVGTHTYAKISLTKYAYLESEP